MQCAEQIRREVMDAEGVRSSNTGVGHDVCAHGLVPCPFLPRAVEPRRHFVPGRVYRAVSLLRAPPVWNGSNVVVLQQSGGSITATFFAVYRSTALFRKRAWTSRWCALEFSWRHNPSTSPRAMREGDSRVMCRTRVKTTLVDSDDSPHTQVTAAATRFRQVQQKRSTDGGGVLTAPTEPRAGVAKHQRLHVYYFPSDVNVCT